ncbi:MAG: phosphopyruvate hydratase [Deltaproteobacteria bacterium]|nr:phosphopyruvate hydratase [Deltaproteobacteria bacterium]
MSEIVEVHGREVLDSRGEPTVEVEVYLASGIMGRAIVPAGKTTGRREVKELRDGDPARFRGKGVLKAVENVNQVIAPELIGLDARDQRIVDRVLTGLDPSERREGLGGNAILGASLAVAHAAAESLGIGLFEYLGGKVARRLPVPLVNVINGGGHATNNLDIQEFMLVPTGPSLVPNGLRATCEVFDRLRGLLEAQGASTAYGDEGGFAPSLDCSELAIELLQEAVRKAGYEVHNHFRVALDVAGNHLFDRTSERYRLNIQPERGAPPARAELTTAELVRYYEGLLARFPAIASIEDPFHEDDWDGFAALTASVGSKVQIVGDDLFVSQTRYLSRGIKSRAANAILVKPNQVGTLSETLDTVAMAQRAGFGTVISHRSGDTEDTTIADLAVAVGAGQIKTGSVTRSERCAKYNRLLRIESHLVEPIYVAPYA